MRVLQFLEREAIRFEPLIYPPAFTAQKRAMHLGISGRQVAKAVLLLGPSEYVLAVLPASHHVDTRRLAEVLGGPVRLAREEEIAEVFRDCEYGVVEPFGTLYGLKTFLDESLSPDDWVVFEAHTHAEAVRMRCSDFERLEHPQRMSFARPNAEATKPAAKDRH